MIGSLQRPQAFITAQSPALADALTAARRLAARIEQLLADATHGRTRPHFGEVDLASYIRARTMRRAFFGDLFADPVWDMILGLVLSERLGERVSVSALCIWSDVPATTALRHIRPLEDAGLIVRVPDPQDRRRSWVELSPRGCAAWDAWNLASERVVDR